MSEVWAVITIVILAMIIYAYIAAKIKERKRKKAEKNRYLSFTITFARGFNTIPSSMMAANF